MKSPKQAAGTIDVVRLVGRNVADAELKRALAGWGVKLPPAEWDDGLEEWDGFFKAKLAAHGVELCFDLAQVKKKTSRRLVDAALFGARYRGPLPHGLVFGEPQRTVRPKLGHFSAPDKRSNGLRGDTFRIKGTRLYGVAIYRGPSKKLVELGVTART